MTMTIIVTKPINLTTSKIVTMTMTNQRVQNCGVRAVLRYFVFLTLSIANPIFIIRISWESEVFLLLDPLGESPPGALLSHGSATIRFSHHDDDDNDDDDDDDDGGDGDGIHPK